MWLNEFKTGDIVEDRYGNVVEIKQIFKTGTMKIKVIDQNSFIYFDVNGFDLKKNKTYVIDPDIFENDWKLKVDQKVEEFTLEQIDSKISELQ